MNIRKVLSAFLLTVLFGFQVGVAEGEKKKVTPRQYLEQGGYDAAQKYLEKLAKVVLGAEGEPFFDVDLKLIKQNADGQPRFFTISSALKSRRDLRDKLKTALAKNFRPPAIGPIRKIFNNVVSSVAEIIYVLEGNYREMAADLDTTTDFPALLNKIKDGVGKEKDNAAKTLVINKIMEIADISVGQPDAALNGADVVKIGDAPVDGYVLNKHTGLSGDEFGTWGKFLGAEVFAAIDAIKASMGVVAEPEPEAPEGPTLDSLGSEDDFAKHLENARGLFEDIFIQILKGESQDSLNTFLQKVSDKHKADKASLSPEEHNELVDNVTNMWNISIQALKAQGKVVFADGTPEKENIDYLMGLSPMGELLSFADGDLITISMGGKMVSTQAAVGAPVLMDQGSFFDGVHVFQLAKDAASGKFAMMVAGAETPTKLSLDSAGEMVNLVAGTDTHSEKELFELKGPSGAVQVLMNVGGKAGFVRKFAVGGQEMLKFSEGTAGATDTFDIRAYKADSPSRIMYEASDPVAVVNVVKDRLAVTAAGAAQADVDVAKKTNNRLLNLMEQFLAWQEDPASFAGAVNSGLVMHIATQGIAHDAAIIDRIKSKLSLFEAPTGKWVSIQHVKSSQYLTFAAEASGDVQAGDVVATDNENTFQLVKSGIHYGIVGSWLDAEGDENYNYIKVGDNGVLTRGSVAAVDGDAFVAPTEESEKFGVSGMNDVVNIKVSNVESKPAYAGGKGFLVVSPTGRLVALDPDDSNVAFASTNVRSKFKLNVFEVGEMEAELMRLAAAPDGFKQVGNVFDGKVTQTPITVGNIEKHIAGLKNYLVEPVEGKAGEFSVKAEAKQIAEFAGDQGMLSVSQALQKLRQMIGLLGLGLSDAANANLSAVEGALVGLAPVASPAPVEATITDIVSGLVSQTNPQYFSTADDSAKLLYLNTLGKVVYGKDDDMFEIVGGKFVSKDNDGDGNPDPMPAALGDEFSKKYIARAQVRDAMITFGGGNIQVSDEFKNLVLGMFNVVRGSLTEFKEKLSTMFNARSKDEPAYRGLLKLASFPAVLNTETEDAKKAILPVLLDIADVRLLGADESLRDFEKQAYVTVGGVTRDDMVKKEGLNAFTGVAVYGQDSIFDKKALFDTYDAIFKTLPVAKKQEEVKEAKKLFELLISYAEADRKDRRDKEAVFIDAYASASDEEISKLETQIRDTRKDPDYKEMKLGRHLRKLQGKAKKAGSGRGSSRERRRERD